MSRRFLILCVAIIGLQSSSASAQILEKFIDHVKYTSPQTVHSIIELDYFPSITDSKYGMPVLRFDLNFMEEGDEREVGTPYYHSTWGNAIGYGGNGIIAFEEFISAGLSYKPHTKLAASFTWEPIGIYVNPARGIFGSGLTMQLAFPLVLLEVNERAQGMGIGFLTQKEPNGRMRNVKLRVNVVPGTYVSFTRQAIGITEGPFTSIAFGVGI